MFKELKARAKAIEETLANVNETLTAANKTASLSTRYRPSYLYEHYWVQMVLVQAHQQLRQHSWRPHSRGCHLRLKSMWILRKFSVYCCVWCCFDVMFVVVFDVVLMLCSMLCLVLHIVLSLLQTMFNWRANINLYSSTGGAVQTGTVFSRGYFTPRNI